MKGQGKQSRQPEQWLIIPDCLPLDTTKVLTKGGWDYLRNLKAGTEILVSDSKRNLFWEVPRSIIRQEPRTVYSFTRGNVKFEATGGHRHLLTNPDGSTYIRTTDELLDRSTVSLVANGQIMNDATQSLRLMRLVGFCIGDGTRDTDNWKINVKKQRKKTYLNSLFSEDMTVNLGSRPDYSVYRLRANLTKEVDQFVGADKKINWNKFMSLSVREMEAVLEGIIESDGTRKADRPNIMVHAVREEHIELVQTLAHLTNRNAVRANPIDNSGSTYPSSLPLLGTSIYSNRDGVFAGQWDRENTREVEVGCVTVSTGLFVCAQNDNILITGNCHIPYEDKRAFDLMLAVAQDQQIKNVCVLGDFADFYSISSHGRDADMDGRLSNEVTAVRERLDELEDICSGSRIYIQGNHEWRLERYINSEAPELFGLIDTRSLLQLGNEWQYVPYTPNQLVRIGRSKMWARHEPLTGGTLPAHGSVVKAGCSIIYGHDHKSQEAQVVMANGDTHLGASVGWLGDKNNKAFDYVKGHHQWSLGFGVLTTNVDSKGTFFLNRAIIINYMCIVNGVVYDG